MTTWPSGNKAVTTTTDADSDSISGSRVDINKTISNVNDIIDIFNIPATPTDNYILRYNSATGKFDMEDEQANNAVTDYTNGVDNRIITSTGASTINAESTLLYDGTSLSNTTAPTFTASSTPIQLNGAQPSQGGYHGHITIDTGVSRGAYTYNSRTAGGNFDRHIFFFDLDDDFGNRPTGAYQGDHNVWFNANHATSRFDMYVDGFDTAGIQVFGHGGNSYAYQNLELNAAQIKLKVSGSDMVTVDSNSVTIPDSKNIKIGSNTTIDNDEISRTGNFKIDASGKIELVADATSPTMEFYKDTTRYMRFEDGPGGNTEMKFSGDAFFIQDPNDENLFSIDTSGSDQGITIFSTDETKPFALSMKRDDNTTGGGAYDTTYAFRVPDNHRKIEFEITDSQATAPVAETIWSVEDSAGSATGVPTDVWISHVPFQLKAYASGSMPTDVTAGSIVAVSNNNYKPAYYTGSAWKYVADDSSVT